MKNKTVGIIALCFTFLVIFSSTTVYAYSQNSNQEEKSYVISIMKCSMKWFCFYPCQITVVKGDTVTWVNRDTINHIIISGSGQRGPDGWFTSSIISQNGMYSHVFDRKGAFTYYDSTNPYAQGVVIVGDSLNSDFVKLQQSFFTDWWCSQ